MFNLQNRGRKRIMPRAEKEEVGHWQSKFKILKGWAIEYTKDDEYTGQVHLDPSNKKADICPWGSGEEASDYILHELLHICMRCISDQNTYKKRREAEELFVQDLCIIIGN